MHSTGQLRLVLLKYHRQLELILENASVSQPNNPTDQFYALQWLYCNVNNIHLTPTVPNSYNELQLPKLTKPYTTLDPFGGEFGGF